jgi:hypothetical protein
VEKLVAVTKIQRPNDQTGNTLVDTSLGRIDDIRPLHKFGANENLAQNVQAHVWSGTGSWVAPTTARIHQISSTDVDDTGAGTGAQQVTIWGISSFLETEDSEVITLNGTTDVPTTKAWAVIHRMSVTRHGAAGPNQGLITAVADTDATTTARIEIGEGQTQMAVYGFGHRQSILLTNYFGSIGRSATAAVDLKLYVVNDPINYPNVKILKHQIGLDTNGTTHAAHHFTPPFPIQGPGIICLEAVASANGATVAGGFDAFLYK